MNLSEALQQYLPTRLEEGERVLAATTLAEKPPFNPTDPDSQKATLWLVVTDRHVGLAAALDAERGRWQTWPRGEVRVALDKGIFQDGVSIGELSFALPRGGRSGLLALLAVLGKDAAGPPEPDRASQPSPQDGDPAATTDASSPGDPVTAAQGEPPDASPESPPLPRLGELWWASPPPPVQRAIADNLETDERCLGALKTGSTVPLPEETPLWWVVTDRRQALVAVDKDGQRPLWRSLPAQGLRVETGVAWDTFHAADETLFQGPLIGGGALRQLFGLARLPMAERLMEAGEAHITKRAWEGAGALWEAAWAHLEREADPRQGLAGLQWARSLRALGREGETLQQLKAVARLDPDDDRLAQSLALGLDDKGWCVLLSMAHDSQGHAAAAAALYARLHELDPGQDFFVLQLARNLRDSGRVEEALVQYEAFIEGRLAGPDMMLLVDLVPESEDQAGVEVAGEDADLIAAALESGELLKGLDRPGEAGERYLQLIRQAPYVVEGYARLFALADELPTRRFIMGQAATLLRLLKPEAAQTLEETLGPLPTPPHLATLPTDYVPLNAERHDASLMHPSERDTTSVAQGWLGRMMVEKRDTQDIERHCQRVSERSHPLLKDLMTRLAHLLSIPTPRCYLSHGNTGIQVLDGKDSPFVLLGGLHADEEDARALDTPALAFALGSQLAHVRAGHLILTSSEFWVAFGNRSLDGLMTVLSLIPTAAWLGKLTDGVALRWIDALGKRVEGQSLRALLVTAESQVKKGAVGEGAQSILQSALERLKADDADIEDVESLAKEQLADFARGALYSADRVGLLACDDIGAAVEAIFCLSTRAFEELPSVRRYGLAQVLSRRDAQGHLVYKEMSMRLSELFRFALSDAYVSLRRDVFPELHDDSAPVEGQDDER